MTQATADGVKVSAGELEQLAEKATPGPWHWFKTMFGWKALDATGRIDQQSGEKFHVIYCRNDGLAGIREADAAYIAAANPKTLLALLADWRKLRLALQSQCECVDLDAEVIVCEGCKVLRGLNVRD